MLWLSFARWSSSSGAFFVSERVYRNGQWTPLVKVRRRYKSWFGFFGSN